MSKGELICSKNDKISFGRHMIMQLNRTAIALGKAKPIVSRSNSTVRKTRLPLATSRRLVLRRDFNQGRAFHEDLVTGAFEVVGDHDMNNGVNERAAGFIDLMEGALWSKNTVPVLALKADSQLRTCARSYFLYK
jgi:hypothetical protein